MDNIILEAKKFNKSLNEDKFLPSLLFGFGRTLQEFMDTKSSYSLLRSVGNNMIDYLNKNNITIKIDKDPFKTLVNVWAFYVDNGYVEKVEIEKTDDIVSVKAYKIFGSPAFKEMYKTYGKKTHVRPDPLLFILLAVMAKIDYEVSLVDLDYKKDEDIWLIKLNIKEIKFQKLY